jgi:hypothetical protein
MEQVYDALANVGCGNLAGHLKRHVAVLEAKSERLKLTLDGFAESYRGRAQPPITEEEVEAAAHAMRDLDVERGYLLAEHAHRHIVYAREQARAALQAAARIRTDRETPR